jgi:hypothetical protein
MIITKIGCCLRPLGIVLNEHRPGDDLSFIPYIRVNPHVLFKYGICSFITNPYGRVHPFLVIIIRGALDTSIIYFKVMDRH